MSVAEELHRILFENRLGYVSWYDTYESGAPALKQLFRSTYEEIMTKGKELSVEDAYTTGRFGMTLFMHLVSNNYYDIVKSLLEKGVDPNVPGKEGDGTFSTDYTGVTPLHAACYSSNLKMVKLLLKYGADTTIKDSKGRNCFHYLPGFGLLVAHISSRNFIEHHVLEQTKEIIRLLKCDINEKDNNGQTPLFYLLKKDIPSSLYMTQLFLDSGADMHIIDNDGNTVLMHAAYNNHITAARIFMEHKDFINHQNKDGDTALTLAYKNRNYKMMYMLLKRGADPDLCNNENECMRNMLTSGECYEADELFDTFISSKRIRVADYFKLWSKLDVNFWGKDDIDENEFHYDIARDILRRIDPDDETEHVYIKKIVEQFVDANRGNYVIKMLLEEGYDLNMLLIERSQVTTIRDICFEEGIYRKNNGIKELIEAGVDVNAPLVDGKTPAYILVDSVGKDSDDHVYEGCIANLEHLSVESMEHIDNNGDSAIHLAAKKFNNPIIIDYMIKRGVNLNITSEKQGNTPLHLACYNYHVEVVKSLVMAGADDSITNMNGEIPAYTLFDNNDKFKSREAYEILKYLKTVDTGIAYTGETPLLRMLRRSPNYEYEMIETFIDKGVDINHTDNSGNTPLIVHADRRGDTDIVKLLLEEGADINARNDKGNTALMYIIKHGNNELARYLIKKGADYNTINKDNQTPVSIAIENGMEAVLQLMNNITVFPVEENNYYDDDDDYDDYDEDDDEDYDDDEEDAETLKERIRNSTIEGYISVFGKEKGEELGKLVLRMGELQEAGINDSNIEEYQELGLKVQKIMESI